MIVPAIFNSPESVGRPWRVLDRGNAATSAASRHRTRTLAYIPPLRVARGTWIRWTKGFSEANLDRSSDIVPSRHAVVAV